jgi:hypothetical protein
MPNGTAPPNLTHDIAGGPDQVGQARIVGRRDLGLANDAKRGERGTESLANRSCLAGNAYWSGLGTSFPSFFFEQGFDRFLAGAIGGAGLFVLLAVAAQAILGRWLPPDLLSATVLATGVVLVLWAIGLTFFEAAALWYRSAPPGSGTQKLGAAHEAFLDHTRFAFFALYVCLLVAAFGCGLLFGRLRGGSGLVTALAASSIILLFLALTLPRVEFSNSCNVGQSFVLDENDC